ncbi:S-adenosyl-L-methionine-dependent methyltransferase [Xylaria bambusicola]|uniref:S-adenosyl-L-methionine-dependent methyltransferase n=1 Tax=Xylaria bambusicola TaxID=326684 RepID=UPI002007AC46|nr:S-adenosyl-L-methionine-dependent methyltransferase [Xylaria bambusicola]KAI0505609.1 S-adenosyl-L-methionine-dependent methyltransferase [Xylaria bambusicola]
MDGQLGIQQILERPKVTLTGVTETLLIPLLGRAADAATERPILGDRYAKGVLEKLDYDFGKLPMPPTHAGGVALRARFYDRWTSAFLSSRSHTTVLHLACGLDSRNQRIEWGPNVRWIDIDLPDVVDLRRQVLPTSLPGQDYRLVSADVTDDAWLKEIPTDRPVVVVMEGLLSYLEPEDATGLLKRLVETFQEGELHFDSMSAMLLKEGNKQTKMAVSKTGAKFKWAVDDLKEIEKIHPHLRMLEAIRYIEAPGVEELPILSRIGYYMLSWMPSMRDSVRFVRFGFSDDVKEGNSC